ncbi:kinase-like domain-containing protein [Haematococcus lacustris]
MTQWPLPALGCCCKAVSGSNDMLQAGLSEPCLALAPVAGLSHGRCRPLTSPELALPSTSAAIASTLATFHACMLPSHQTCPPQPLVSPAICLPSHCQGAAGREQLQEQQQGRQPEEEQQEEEQRQGKQGEEEERQGEEEEQQEEERQEGQQGLINTVGRGGEGRQGEQEEQPEEEQQEEERQEGQQGHIEAEAGGPPAVKLIDYDYSAWSNAAFDIANHWCEWAADYSASDPSALDFSRFPNTEQRQHFISAYLLASRQPPPHCCLQPPSPASPAIEGLQAAGQLLPGCSAGALLVQQWERCCLAWSAASHLHWLLWGLLQDNLCPAIDFNYAGYAAQRWQQYVQARGVLKAAGALGAAAGRGSQADAPQPSRGAAFPASCCPCTASVQVKLLFCSSVDHGGPLTARLVHA